MADNFLQFSMSFPLKTIAERAWCIATMAAFESLLRSDHEQEDEVKQKIVRDLGALGQRVLAEGWDYCDFEWSIEPVTPKNPDQVGKMWIYAEESGSPEQVAAFLQMYLKKFDPQGSLWFSWAYSCSKMRVNEFGGGAAVVTATSSTFIDAQDWAQERGAKGEACTSR